MPDHTSKMPSEECQNKFDRFEAWLRDSGASFDFLELREYDAPVTDEGKPLEETDAKEEGDGIETERGVHACVDIPEDTVCMVVPSKCLITLDMGKALPIGQKIIKADLDLHAPRHIFLMLYVLWDMNTNGSSSFFHPYYDILPSTFQNLPIFWSEEELAFLDGSFLQEEVKQRIAAIQEDYDDVMRVAPDLLKEISPTIEAFKWARMVVTSRNFAFDMNGKRMSALVPHADMLNHRRPCETRWTFNDHMDAFTITTLTDVPAGGQVYDSYGMKSNHRFLLNYGFSLEDNTEQYGECPNMVPINFEVSKTDPMFQTRMAYWMWEGPNAAPSSDEEESLDDEDDDDNDDEEKSETEEEDDDEDDPDIVEVVINVASTSGQVEVEEKSNGMKLSDESQIPQDSELPDEAEPQVDDEAHNSEEDTEHEEEEDEEDEEVAPEYSDSDRTKSMRVSVPFDDDDAMISLLRSLACNADELAMITGASEEPSIEVYGTCEELTYPINLRNERAAMQILLDTVDKTLNKYARTLEEDIEDLHDQAAYPPFSNRRNAKIQVKGEKEVLHHYLLLGRTALKVIQVVENENEARDCKQSFETCIMELVSEGVHPAIVSYCDQTLDYLRSDDKEHAYKRPNSASADGSEEEEEEEEEDVWGEWGK